jgi:hypothetical protein
MIRFMDRDEAELWKDVAVAFTSASNATNVKGAIEWADKIVKAYQERHEEEKPEEDDPTKYSAFEDGGL